MRNSLELQGAAYNRGDSDTFCTAREDGCVRRSIGRIYRVVSIVVDIGLGSKQGRERRPKCLKGE